MILLLGSCITLKLKAKSARHRCKMETKRNCILVAEVKMFMAVFIIETILMAVLTGKNVF